MRALAWTYFRNNGNLHNERSLPLSPSRHAWYQDLSFGVIAYFPLSLSFPLSPSFQLCAPTYFYLHSKLFMLGVWILCEWAMRKNSSLSCQCVLFCVFIYFLIYSLNLLVPTKYLVPNGVRIIPLSIVGGMDKSCSRGLNLKYYIHTRKHMQNIHSSSVHESKHWENSKLYQQQNG